MCAATVARQLPEYERAIFAGISTGVVIGTNRVAYHLLNPFITTAN